MANFEGAVNDPTLTCNVTNAQGAQATTLWSLGNYQGVAATRQLTLLGLVNVLFSISGDQITNTSFTFENHITILNWTSTLDRAILVCGTGRTPEQANVTLRIYSKLFITRVHQFYVPVCSSDQVSDDICRSGDCTCVEMENRAICLKLSVHYY